MTGAETSRPTILVMLPFFTRGVEATGPNQSMIGMAKLLGSRFRFRVVAVEPEPQEEGWTTLAGLEQISLKKLPFGAKGLRRLLRSTPHDLVLMNSMFDRNLTIPTLLMRRFGLIPRKPALLAPRGEFAPGALSMKAGRKRAHLALGRRLGLFDGVAMQATSDEEAERIARRLPGAGPILLGPNVRPMPLLPPHAPRRPGDPLRIAFLGRVSRIKNLDFALEALAKARRPARFEIFGPLEDPVYWAKCEQLIAAMPPEVEVRHRGVLPQAEVFATMARFDLLLLPTGGENFGHAIFEALAAGTPVLLSDQTPWRNLEERSAGWDLPLDRPDAFVDAIRRASEYDEDRWQALRRGARLLAEEFLPLEATAAKLADCLQAAMGGASAPAAPAP